tara:strand:- start:1008 stop:1607 length:600 start_codon:yes stop_codon:yes gene_type:complete
MGRRAYIETPSTAVINTQGEAKAHLRVDFTDDDTYIDSLCLAAKQTIENYCNVKLLRDTIIQYCDKWEDTKELYFSPSLNSASLDVTKIKFYNSDNAVETWEDTNYTVDNFSAPATISLLGTASYPNLYNRANAIEVYYTCGATSAADIPDQLKQAGLILIGNMYENRQEIIVGRSVGSIPMTARYLMDPYKIQTLGQC